jgi:hypothetical protein
MRLTVAVLLVGLALALTGCKKEKSNQASSPATSSDPLLAAWKAAGLEVAELKPSDKPIAAGTCKTGVVGGLETTVCTYPDAAAAKKAEEAGLAVVGETTGLAVVEGSALLVVADRTKADPSGKRMNDIAKAFRAQSQPKK